MSAFDVVPTRPEKLKRGGGPQAAGAGTLSDARAARALLLGHGFVAFWRALAVQCLGRAQSLAGAAPRSSRGGSFAAAQRCFTKLESRFGRVIARTGGQPEPRSHAWSFGKMLTEAAPGEGRISGRRLRAAAFSLCARHGSPRGAGPKCPRWIVARPMTSTK